MALHFSREEYAQRRERLRQLLADRGLNGLLCFAQESMYYLTGYDSFGFCFFQCLYIGTSGEVSLLTRAPDLRQAQHTSDIEDIRIWEDGAEGSPGRDLRDLLESHNVGGGGGGGRFGIELDTHGLTARNADCVRAALEGCCHLEDGSELVSRLRVVKSAAELAYVRKAAALADAAYDAGLAETRAGADEGHILAAIQGAVFRGGGDYPGNPFIIGSGRDALLCRYKAGRRCLSAQDQLTLEFAGVYRHYHAALMRTIIVGKADREHESLHQAAREALEACESRLKAGNSVGDVFAAHAEVLDAAGYGAHRMNACGYAMGARYAPSWMDWPMFYANNPVVLEENMTFFLHMILMNSDTGRAITLGHSLRVTDGEPERLSGLDLSLVVV